MDRSMIRAGFGLILIGLLTGFVIPQLANPRLGLAAHSVAIIGGILLIAIGAVASAITLSAKRRKLMNGCWLYASYTNWLACLVGGATGASRLTPMAGAGTTGSPAAEWVVQFLLISLSVAAVVACGLALSGLGSDASRRTGT